MRARQSLTTRTVLGFGALGLCLGIVLAVVTYFAVEYHEEVDIHDMLALELEQLRHVDGTVSHTVGLFSSYQVPSRERNGVPAPLRDLEAGVHWFEDGDPPLAVRVERENGWYRVAAYDLTGEQGRDTALQIILSANVLLATYLAIWGGYWLARRILEPVRRLAGNVRSLQPADRPPTLAEQFADDEVGELARAFDDYHHRIAELLERERWFASHASHELRTPLTVMRGALELARTDPGAGQGMHRRLDRMERATKEMESLIELFLLLARSPDAMSEHCGSVRPVVERVLSRERHWLRSEDVQVTIEDHGDAPVTGPESVLQVVIANLIRNAFQHTERGQVRITVAPGRVAVADTGSGMSEADRLRAFQASFQGGEDTGRRGGGLGLHIVKQLCDRYGWRIALEPSEPAGTRAVLHLPFTEP